jgi:outer membrane protein assembly factor BamA
VPTRGRFQRAFAEVALPVLDLEYYRLTYQFQQFLPVSRFFTLAFNTELGFGNGYGGKPYPFFKNFYVGGIGSVRGFEAATLGPRDVYGDPLGGTRRFNANFEALVPFPGADKPCADRCSSTWDKCGDLAATASTPSRSNSRRTSMRTRAPSATGITPVTTRKSISA